MVGIGLREGAGRIILAKSTAMTSILLLSWALYSLIESTLTKDGWTILGIYILYWLVFSKKVQELDKAITGAIAPGYVPGENAKKLLEEMKASEGNHG